MPMEFYQGRPLKPEELEAIRQQIEQFDTIEVIDPEMRGIVERKAAFGGQAAASG
jgi:hypothetical protein